MSVKPEALRLAEELYAFHAAKKEMPSVGGQMLGLESYRIVTTREVFSQILDAADKLLRQHAEIERLKADNEALRREAERLWEALKHYGKHDDDCGDHDAYNNESLRHCGCGLDAVLDDALTASTAPASTAPEAKP
jgi:hypothetical protein